MSEYQQWLKDAVGISHSLQTKFLYSLVTIVILSVARYVLLKLAAGKTRDPNTQYRVRKMSAYIAVFVGLLILGNIWFSGFSSITTFLGLLSAGLAVALKAPIMNFAGWLAIVARRPFDLGDRIQIGEHRGDVVGQTLLTFSILEVGNWVDADQSTGRVIMVPNGRVFTETLANYNKGFAYIWNEIAVLITFESAWPKAKAILEEIVRDHAPDVTQEVEKSLRDSGGKMVIRYSNLTPTVYTSVRDCGVLLTLRYLCQPRQRRSTEQVIWEDVLQRFAACVDIDFAYPTQRFYSNLREGKQGTISEEQRHGLETPAGNTPAE